MKPQKHLLAIGTALLFGASGLLAQTTSGGTSSGSTSTSGTSTTSTSSTGGTSTGTTSTGSTSTGTTSTGSTSGGTTSSSGSTVGTSTGSTSTGGTSTGSTSTGGTSTGSTSTGGTSTGSTSTGSMHGKANPHTPNANASAVAQAVQTMLAKFDANRDQYMTERKALLDKLAAATTEADRQAILAQLKADLQTEKDQRTQLGKEIRDQLKTLRKGGG